MNVLSSILLALFLFVRLGLSQTYSLVDLTPIQFYHIIGLAVDSSQQNIIFIEDNGSRIRKLPLTHSGDIIDYPLQASLPSVPMKISTSYDPSGSFFYMDNTGKISKSHLTANDPDFLYTPKVVFESGHLTSSPFENTVFATLFSSYHDLFQIVKLSNNGKSVQEIVTGSNGWLDGPCSSAQFNMPAGIAVYPDGVSDILIADNGNNMIRKIQLVGQCQVKTLAKSGKFEVLQSRTDAKFVSNPYQIQVDQLKNLIVSHNSHSNYLTVISESDINAVITVKLYTSLTNDIHQMVISGNAAYLSDTLGNRLLKLVICSTEEFFNRINNTCLSCQAGQQLNHETLRCELCPTGKHKQQTGVSECIVCPEGTLPTETRSECAQPLNGSNKWSIYLMILIGTMSALAAILAVVTLHALVKKIHAYQQTQKELLALSGFGIQNSKVMNDTLNADKNATKVSIQISANSYNDSNIIISTGSLAIPSPRLTASSDKAAKVNITLSTKSEATLTTNGSGMYIPAFMLFYNNVDFRIDKAISTGASATIHLATPIDKRLTRRNAKRIVVKLFTKLESDISFDAFYQEVSAMYMLRDCRYVAKIFGYSEQPHTVLLKYYSKGSLSDYLYTHRRLKSKRLLLKFASNIGEGIEYMFKLGLAHCDLKTANLLIDTDAKTKELICVLSDFGISCLVNADALVVKEFHAVRIPGLSFPYASPESIVRVRHAQGKRLEYTFDYHPMTSDIYSYAMILYVILTRREVWSVL